MARSSRTQAEANHQRITAVAGELFRAKGFDAVGIADVMKAAGMTQGGFYKHFSSKEALACEALRAGFDGAAKRWRGDESVAPASAALVEMYLRPQSPEYCCPMLAHSAEAAQSGGDSDMHNTYIHGAQSLHKAFLDVAGSAKDDREANLVFSAMVGAAMLARATGEASWIEDLKDAVRQAAAHLDARRTTEDKA